MIHSLQALGLAPDADEREVRRAYARRVKAIDPATDPGAFQTLREHYEAALAWVRMRPPAHAAGTEGDIAEPPSAAVETPAAAVPMPAPWVASEPEPEAPAPTAAPGSADHPPDASEPVFDGFFSEVAREFKYVATAGAALERALEDPRLVNLEARARFELRVAQLLAQGWQPGHQFLFVAACDTFNWERDRSRLSLFGPVGALLDAAITQSLIFYDQPEQLQFVHQRSLVIRLRDDEAPSNDTLAKERERLQVLVQRYPHWLRIVTSGANVARWQEALQGLPPPQATAQGSRGANDSSDKSSFLKLIGILVAFASISVVLASVFGRVPGPSRTPQYQVPGAPTLSASGPLWAPAPLRKPPPNPLKPLRELPTLSETDPANAPWRNGISYELVPRSPQGPASAPLLGP